MLADDGAWVQMVEIYSCGKKFDVFSEVEPCLFTLNISVNSSLIIKINDSFGILMTRSKEIQIGFYRLEHPLHWNWVELNWSPGCHDNRITPNLGESQVDEGNWEPLMRSRKEKKTSIRKLIREARENINLHVVSF